MKYEISEKENEAVTKVFSTRRYGETEPNRALNLNFDLLCETQTPCYSVFKFLSFETASF